MDQSRPHVIRAAEPLAAPRRRRTITRNRWQVIASVCIGFLVWELITARLHLVNSLFLASPMEVIETAISMARSGELAATLGMSLYRAGMGFAIGATSGMVFGLAAGFSPLARNIVSPYVAAAYPLPKLALLPLFILWLGIGELSKISLIAFGSFFYTFVSSQAGVTSVEPVLVKAVRNLGASNLQVFTKVILPQMLPVIVAGYKLAAGGSLLLLVAAEMVGAEAGIGYMLMNAGELMDTSRLFVGLAVLSILGVVIYNLFDFVERRLAPWRETVRPVL